MATQGEQREREGEEAHDQEKPEEQQSDSDGSVAPISPFDALIFLSRSCRGTLEPRPCVRQVASWSSYMHTSHSQCAEWSALCDPLGGLVDSLFTV